MAIDSGPGNRRGSDEGFGGLDLALSPLVVASIGIDIKPGSEGNPIHPMSRGVIPVAIQHVHPAALPAPWPVGVSQLGQGRER